MRPELEPALARPSPVRVGMNLAASWYIACTADEIGRAPRALDLFGEPRVAWRDGQGGPVIMARHCPHMGADLAAGKVVDGCLRCPFHHWRFTASGQCAEIPGIDRIPATARQPVVPAVERYGYVWAWYGSDAPMFALPELPAFEANARYRYFRFADMTGATVRRILENTYDPDHLVALHGLRVEGGLALTMLSDPEDSRDNGPLIPADIWLGATVEWPRYAGTLGMIMRLFGKDAQHYRLLVDGWPAGQRITVFADGEEQYKLLLATTPVAPGRTVQHIAVAIARRRAGWADLVHYLVSRLEIKLTSDQDIPIFASISPDDRESLYIKRDTGVIRFREYYQRWVDRAQVDSEPASR